MKKSRYVALMYSFTVFEPIMADKKQTACLLLYSVVRLPYFPDSQSARLTTLRCVTPHCSSFLFYTCLLINYPVVLTLIVHLCLAGLVYREQSFLLYQQRHMRIFVQRPLFCLTLRPALVLNGIIVLPGKT